MELPNSMAATTTSSATAEEMVPLTPQIIKAKISAAHQFIHNENHDRARIVENLQTRKLDRESLVRKLMYLVPMEFRCRRKRTMRRLDYAQPNLHQLHIPTIEEEQLIKEPESIKTLIYKIRHGTKSMVEEKRIFRAMKHAADLPSDKQTKNNHTIKPTTSFNEIQEMRKQKRAFNANVEHLKGELEAANKNILSLQNQLDHINRKKQEIYEYILQLGN